MVWTLYALLTDEAPALSSELLERRLRTAFHRDADVSITGELLPFAQTETLALSWEDWFTRLSYEQGEAVREDSAEIAARLGTSAPPALAQVARRVRAVLGTDPNAEYTNQAIFVIEFLATIPGVLLFDSRHNDLLTFPRHGGQERRPGA